MKGEKDMKHINYQKRARRAQKRKQRRELSGYYRHQIEILIKELIELFKNQRELEEERLKARLEREYLDYKK